MKLSLFISIKKLITGTSSQKALRFLTFLFISICICSSLLFGKEGNEYLPLKVGNIWYYDAMTWWGDYMQSEVIDTIRLKDTLYYRYYTKHFNNDSSTNYATIDTIKQDESGRVYKYRLAGDYKIYDFSVNDSDSFISEIRLFPDSNIFYTVMLNDVGSKTVPAGTFDSCKMEFYDAIPDMFDEEYYLIFAPGVGCLMRYFEHGAIANLTSAIVDGEHIGPIGIKKYEKNRVNNQRITANSLKGLKRVELYDLTGRKIKTLSSNSWRNWNEGSGIYVVKLVGESSSVIMIKHSMD